MEIERLEIHKATFTNFRNLEPNVIEFTSGINCIYGNNGNGKTNLLEGIYFLANNKSFRKKTGYSQILSTDSGKNEIIITLLTRAGDQRDTHYSIKFSDSDFKCFKNGDLQKNRMRFGCLFINPFDSFVFHNDPSFRRKWIDSSISAINPRYKKLINSCGLLVRQRNFLLKNRKNNYLSQIDAIDDVLIDYYQKISADRCDFINEINPICKGIFYEIFSEFNTIYIELNSSICLKNKEQIKKILKGSLEKDLLLGRTNIGPHRDDLILYFDDINSFEFCSLGQQKMSYLSLLFAYIKLFRYKNSAFPIVLMDDISGELDTVRLSKLVDYLNKGECQVLLTTANEGFMEKLSQLEDVNLLEVKEGKVSRVN